MAVTCNQVERSSVYPNGVVTTLLFLLNAQVANVYKSPDWLNQSSFFDLGTLEGAGRT